MSDKLPPTCRIVCRPLQFASPTKEQQYRTEIDHVQQYICAQLGGLDDASIQLLGVHDSRTRSSYEEIQEFLERKHQLTQQKKQQRMTQYSEHVFIDEYLNELDPSLFLESEPTTKVSKRFAVVDLPVHSSYIRRKQEEAMAARLWTKNLTAETDCCTTSFSFGNSIKRPRVV
ncbi:unnamed protein product [Peronospora belbahrii]|uniref:Uncharacterized protein n=1 Tax=Peronospora belbahrii TaxID=622444 RepID=A0AAU9KP62_9STRA|nr:unnamed protein product [Peronospora belbahrii]CAH0520621.1 unnamed protein product [Peronospora belbahrii]